MQHKTFIHYDRSTGEITAITTEHEQYFSMRQARGEPVLEVPGPMDPRDHKVDLETMKVVRKVE